MKVFLPAAIGQVHVTNETIVLAVLLLNKDSMKVARMT